MDVLAVVMLVLVVVVNGGDSILGGSLVNIISITHSCRKYLRTGGQWPEEAAKGIKNVMINLDLGR